MNLTSSSTLNIELGGTMPGTQYDQVKVSGQVDLAGTLQVALINPGTFTPTLGEKFDILDWGTRSGKFASLSLPTLASPLAWNTSSLYTTGELSIIDSNYIPGDINRDGSVTTSDISAFMAALANLNGYELENHLTDPLLLREVADVNGDAVVNNLDIQSLISLVANNIVIANESPPQGSASSESAGSGRAASQSTAVPESPSLALLSIGAIAIAYCICRNAKATVHCCD